MSPSNLLPSQLVAKWLPALAHGFEPAPGALVTPRLRLIRHVGDERTGSLWVADHLALATPVEVAFAEVQPDAPPESQAGALALRAQSFQAQAEVTALVNEPHLVSIIEHGDVRGLPYIVTELLEGRCLRQRLLHGPAKLGEVQTIVVQASGALAKAHSLGVIHGRIRPDYLYLTELAQKPFLKLAGFGEIVDDAQAAEQHPYSSPEQLLGTVNDVRADLWAFAVSLYELLTTTLPFEAPTPHGVSAAICNADFARPTHYRADLPAAVDAWFARALAKDPAQRFADATELARTFCAALANEAPSHAPSSGAGAVSLPPPPAQPSLPRAQSQLQSQGYSRSAAAPPPMPGAVSLSDASLQAGPSLQPGLPLPSFPPPSSGPPPLPGAASSRRPDELELELADGDDDEQTVQWDVPEEREGAGAVGPSSMAPIALPSLASRLPMLPLPAPLSPAALSSVALPSTSSQRASAGPLGAPPASLGAPPNLEPSVYLDSPYMASVASALAVPIHPVAAAEPPPPALQASRWWQFTADKVWLAALAFAVGVGLTWFVYEPGSDESTSSTDVASADNEPSVIRTLSVDDLPRAPGEEAELPKIVRTSQLPAADDAVNANAAAVTPPPERRATPVQRVQALAPAPARARPQPEPRAAQPPPRAKAPVEARSNCSPPYYFDEKGIQRIKNECLNGSGMIAGPYGAAVPAHAAAKTAPTPTPPPAKSPNKPASSACDPPYYFEGKIRRLKLECL